jgi:hypothetical protein
MSAPWRPLNGNVGQHHDWTNCPSGSDIAPYWERFEESYSKPTSKNTSVLPTAIYFCKTCHILVPQDGPRPEDQDCYIIVVREIMES